MISQNKNKQINQSGNRETFPYFSKNLNFQQLQKKQQLFRKYNTNHFQSAKHYSLQAKSILASYKIKNQQRSIQMSEINQNNQVKFYHSSQYEQKNHKNDSCKEDMQRSLIQSQSEHERQSHEQNQTKIIIQSNHQGLANRQKNNSIDTCLVGIWIGISLSFIVVLLVIIQINDFSLQNDSDFSKDFPTWRGVAIFIFYIWMLGLDLYMFQKYSIDYVKIFQFKQNHCPQAITLFKIAGLQTSVFLILFLMYVLAQAEIYHMQGFTVQYFALICWGFFLLFLFFPLPIFSNKGRLYFFKLIFQALISPCNGVTFSVAYLTDQALSLAVPIKDLQYTICYYTTVEFHAPDTDDNPCADSNRVSTVLILSVSICFYRMIQCIRQGYDNKSYILTPYFFNTLKFLSTIITTVCAFLYKIGQERALAAWLFFAVITSIYSFYWDVKMDWGFLEINNNHPFLRKRLIFKPTAIYYAILISNFFMRLAWILTLSPNVAKLFGHTNILFLVTGTIQIFRRGICNILKVQKQHLNIYQSKITDQLFDNQQKRNKQSIQKDVEMYLKRMIKQNQSDQRQKLQTQKNDKNLKVKKKLIIEFNEEEIQSLSKYLQSNQEKKISN